MTPAEYRRYAASFRRLAAATVQSGDFADDADRLLGELSSAYDVRVVSRVLYVLAIETLLTEARDQATASAGRDAIRRRIR